jgi:hypothetical protein
MRKLVPLVLMLIATGAACSHDCTTSLADLGKSCPATFAGTIDAISCAPYETIQVYSCAPLLVLDMSGGFVGGTCVYDATSHTLVGASERSDTNDLCGDSLSETAGRIVPASCFAAGPAQQKTCPAPDTGADAGSHAGSD